MKNTRQIIKRFFNVLYVFLILFGLGFSYVISLSYAPYTTTTTSSIVHCDNGKTFDPSSKPIYPNDGYQYTPPQGTREREIGSECKYGTAYFIGDSVAVSDNYTEEVKTYTHYFGSLKNQITAFFASFFVYMLLLEIVRRVALYILFGKSLLALK